MNNFNFLIIGLGLLGGSYAEGLTKKGYNVYGIDTNQESVDFALNKGWIKEGTTVVSKEFIEKQNVVIFCLYPHNMIEWLKDYQAYLTPGTIITDVTGVKKYIYDELRKFLRNDVEFIGCHPMAGKEVSGIKNSDANIFKNANYIIIENNNSLEAIHVAKTIGKELEFKNISFLGIEEHDEMIGFLSQLTHCIAVSLMTCKKSTQLVEYTGDSFRDLTRIAKINENMWSELFLLNKEELLKQMDIFLNQFINLKNAIANDNIEQMKEMMRLSTKWRGYFDKKESD